MVGGGPRVVVSTAAFHARVRGSVPGLGGLKETKLFLPHPRVKVSIVGSLRDREVACSASDRQGSNFESCVWRTVSSQSSHHPQEVLLAQFSLYVHKGGLKPDSFHFIYLSGMVFQILHILKLTMTPSPPFQISQGILPPPPRKPFYSNGQAIWPGFPDIKYTKVKNGRRSAILNLIKLKLSWYIPTWNRTFCSIVMV